MWVDKYGKYNGIKIFIDERNATLSLPFDLTKYNDYVYVDKPFSATAQDRESMSFLRLRREDSSNNSNQ